MFKVAMLSKWHVHAGGYANMIKGSGKAEIAAVWDDDKARGEAWAKELGAEFIPDLDNRLFGGQLLQLRRIHAYDYMRDLIEWLEIHPNNTLVDGISATRDKLNDYRRMTADYYKSTT